MKTPFCSIRVILPKSGRFTDGKHQDRGETKEMGSQLAFVVFPVTALMAEEEPQLKLSTVLPTATSMAQDSQSRHVHWSCRKWAGYLRKHEA